MKSGGYNIDFTLDEKMNLSNILEYMGNYEEIIKTLKGLAGDQGRQSFQGIQGRQGFPGIQGLLRPLGN